MCCRPVVSFLVLFVYFFFLFCPMCLQSARMRHFGLSLSSSVFHLLLILLSFRALSVRIVHVSVCVLFCVSVCTDSVVTVETCMFDQPPHTLDAWGRDVGLFCPVRCSTMYAAA